MPKNAKPRQFSRYANGGRNMIIVMFFLNCLYWAG